MHGKIIESKGNNEYVVEFVNGDVLPMKSSQLTKAKDGVTFDSIIAAMNQEGGSSSSTDADCNCQSPVPPAPPAVVPTDGNDDPADDFSNNDDLTVPSTCH